MTVDKSNENFLTVELLSRSGQTLSYYLVYLFLTPLGWLSDGCGLHHFGRF